MDSGVIIYLLAATVVLAITGVVVVVSVIIGVTVHRNYQRRVQWEQQLPPPPPGAWQDPYGNWHNPPQPAWQPPPAVPWPQQLYRGTPPQAPPPVWTDRGRR